MDVKTERVKEAVGKAEGLLAHAVESAHVARRSISDVVSSRHANESIAMSLTALAALAVGLASLAAQEEGDADAGQ